MQLIDTHFHLTFEHAEPLQDILARAKEQAVSRFICIGASKGIESAPAAIRLAEEYPEVWATVGVHPHDAGSYQSLSEIESLASHAKVVAVGETGLDYFRDWAPVEDQKKLFRYTVSFALELGKPLVIHSREAAEDCIEVLKELGADKVGGVFHCYAEDEVFARRLADLNFLVSFTGNLTFKKATEMRRIASEIPLEQIMLETDMPYMAPEPFRGKPSEPGHVAQIAKVLAEAKGVSVEEVAQVTTANAERLFGLS